MQAFALAMMLIGALATLGAGGWFTYLCSKHGLAWVRTKLRARALAAEAALKAKAAEATGDLAEHVNALGREVVDKLGPRLSAIEGKLPEIEASAKALIEQALAPLAADIAALKAKLPG